jgi:hypothetical protein
MRLIRSISYLKYRIKITPMMIVFIVVNDIICPGNKKIFSVGPCVVAKSSGLPGVGGRKISHGKTVLIAGR